MMQAVCQMKAPYTPPSARQDFGITELELQIIDLVCGGYSNQEIAQALDGSESTIRRALLSIFEKLEVANRLELLLFTAQHELLHDE